MRERVRAATAIGAIALACGILSVTASPAAADTSAPATLTAGSPAAQPTPLFAYYYMWFSPSSWSRAKIDYPLIGRYSSSDPAVMRRQIQQAKSAGITGFIVSWKHTPAYDQRLRLLVRVAAAEHFKLAMIYEGLDFQRNPLPVSQIAAGFTYFLHEFAASPAFFRLGGKPLTIWSGTWKFSAAQVARVTGPVRGEMLVLATEKSAAGYARLASVTDGDAYYWSSVNPRTNPDYLPKLDAMSGAVHRHGGYWIAPFAPGFNGHPLGHPTIVPRDGGQTLRSEFAAAVRSSPDILGLISWNEFSENTYVEPSVRFGSSYLRIVRGLRQATPPAPAGPSVPSDPGLSGPGQQPSGRWQNVALLGGFGAVLVAVTGSLGYLLRRRARARAAAAPAAGAPPGWPVSERTPAAAGHEETTCTTSK